MCVLRTLRLVSYGICLLKGNLISLTGHETVDLDLSNGGFGFVNLNFVCYFTSIARQV